MDYLLAIMLLMSPIKITVYKWMPFNESKFRQVCNLLELHGKEEYVSRENPNKQVEDARYAYRELLNAPAIAEAALLPDHYTCRVAVSFYCARVDHVERCLKLYSSYRYVDFEDCLRFARFKKLYWEKCAEATEDNASYLDRRRALMWLQDYQ